MTEIIQGIDQGVNPPRPPRPPRPPWPPQNGTIIYPPSVAPAPPAPVAPPAPPQIVKPKPNQVAPKPLTPRPNKRYGYDLVLVIDAQTLQNGKDNAAAGTNMQFDTMKSELDAVAPTAVDLVAQGMTQQEADMVIAMMKSGKTTQQTEDILAKYPMIPRAHIDQLRDTYALLHKNRKKGLDGQLTQADLKEIASSMGPHLAGNPQATATVSSALSNAAITSTLTQMLNSATPGNNSIPTGSNVLIVLTPTLPPGSVVVLGPDSVLIGPQNPQSLAGPMITTGNVSQVLGLPQGAPVPSSEAKLVTSGALLVNAADSDVNYVVNNGAFSMAPTYSQHLPAGSTWTVEFDKGNDQGNARYTVSDGTYHFTSDGEWHLYKHTYQVTIDNAKGSGDFNYVLNNKEYTLAAGQSKSHDDNYPLIVRFDDGTGAIKQKKLTKGTFVVGVDLSNSTIDLLDPTKDPAPAIADSSGNQPQLGLFGGRGQSSPSSRINLFGNPNISSLKGDDAPWRATEFFPQASNP